MVTFIVLAKIKSSCNNKGSYLGLVNFSPAKYFSEFAVQ